MIEKPIRKYQKQKDYQKHKILRRIKKRNQRRKEAASKIAELALRKKLKLPAFDGGKDEDELLIGGYVAPELIVTPEGNTFRTTESGQPAVSTGALLEAGVPIRRKSKELKNNQKLQGHDEYLAQQAAADEIANARTGGLSEMFADLLTAGFASQMAKGGEQLRNGDYVRGAINMASPLMLGSGVAGDTARALFGAWNLADEDGVRKTWNYLQNGEYGRAALSGAGDLLNAGMFAHGVNQLGQRGADYTYNNLLLPALRKWRMNKMAQDYALRENLLQNDRNLSLPQSKTQQAQLLSGQEQRLLLPDLRKPYQSPNSLISSKDFYDIVKEDGSIDIPAFKRALDIYGKLNGAPHTLNDIVGSDEILNHLLSVAKTAQSAPVPVGSTKQEQVGAALLHDIGKIYGYDHHGSKGAYMLNQRHRQVEDEFADDFGELVPNSVGGPAITHTPYKVKNAVKNHMSDKTFSLEGYTPEENLIRATQFADIARGEDYDVAAIKYPHVLYERQGLRKPQYPDIPLREEIKRYINPWLKDNGYGPSEQVELTEKEIEKLSHGRALRIPTTKTKYTGIPLDATKEEAWQIVIDAMNQHRRVQRGAALSDFVASNPELQQYRDEQLFQQLGRPATDEEKLIWEMEHVPIGKTGGGRRGMSSGENKIRKMDPKKYDGKYVSVSDGTSRQFSDYGNNVPGIKSVAQLSGGVERTPEMSMREYIALNDWDLYNAGQKTSPIGQYNMLASPFRLQTGKSLFYESQKGIPGVLDPIRPQIIKKNTSLAPPTQRGLDLAQKKKDIFLSAPSGEEQSSADNFVRSLWNGWGGDNPNDIRELNHADEYLTLENQIEDINNYAKQYGFDKFQISHTSGHHIAHAEAVRNLYRRLQQIEDWFTWHKKDIDGYLKGDIFGEDAEKDWLVTQSSEDVSRFKIQRMESFINSLYNSNYLSSKEHQIMRNQIGNLYRSYAGVYRSAPTSQNKRKYQDRINKGYGDIIEYLKKRHLFSSNDFTKERFEKIQAKRAIDSYFDEVKKDNKKRIDVADFTRRVHDPERLIQIMKYYQALPRHEMPGFNRQYVINTLVPSARPGGRMTDRQQTASEMAIIGKRGSKVLEPEYNEFVSGHGSGPNYYGRRKERVRSAKKLTKKTIAGLAMPVGIALGASIANTSNAQEYNKGKDPIRIKPSKRGTFTAAAKKRGMGVQQFANKVLKNPSNYSSAMRKKAQFAKNATKFKR